MYPQGILGSGQPLRSVTLSVGLCSQGILGSGQPLTPVCPAVSAGYSGLGPGAEGAAAAAAEAHDPAPPPGRHPDPVSVALLRLRRALALGGHLEDTPDPLPQPAHVSVAATWHRPARVSAAVSQVAGSQTRGRASGGYGDSEEPSGEGNAPGRQDRASARLRGRALRT